MSVVANAREIWQSRELLHNLTQRELRGKYKGSVLGWGWSLINPLATAGIFTIVFSTIMKVVPPDSANGRPSYVFFLMCGLLTWNFMVTGFTGSMASLVANGNLIKKTYFPRRLLLISNVAAAFVSYCIEMAVLLILMQFWGLNVIVWLPLVLVYMVLLSGFSLGLGLIFSVFNVYFRDVSYFVSLFIQLWFYATPVIYPITYVTGPHSATWIDRFHVVTIYLSNPMIYYIEPLRDMLYSNNSPGWTSFVIALMAMVIALLVGDMIFGKLEARLAEEL